MHCSQTAGLQLDYYYSLLYNLSNFAPKATTGRTSAPSTPPAPAAQNSSLADLQFIWLREAAYHRTNRRRDPPAATCAFYHQRRRRATNPSKTWLPSSRRWTARLLTTTAAHRRRPAPSPATPASSREGLIPLEYLLHYMRTTANEQSPYSKTTRPVLLSWWAALHARGTTVTTRNYSDKKVISSICLA